MTVTWNSLQDWNRVLDWLEYATRGHILDSYETDLTWLLRFSDNWRLREATLKALCQLKTPSPRLTSEVLRIIENEYLYPTVQILAAEALLHLSNLAREAGEPSTRKRMTARRLQSLLAERQPPVVADAAQRAMDSVESPPKPRTPMTASPRGASQRMPHAFKENVHELSPGTR